MKRSPTLLSRIDEPVTVIAKGFDGRKLESTTKDGSDLGDEDDENKLEELKDIIVVEGDAEYRVLHGIGSFFFFEKIIGTFGVNAPEFV